MVRLRPSLFAIEVEFKLSCEKRNELNILERLGSILLGHGTTWSKQLLASSSVLNENDNKPQNRAVKMLRFNFCSVHLVSMIA